MEGSMKNVIFVVLGLFLAVAVAGCASRAYIATRDRVDIEVAGNQGVIYGPTPAAHRVANPSRELYTLDVELPTTSKDNKASSADYEPAAISKASPSQANINAEPQKTEKIK